MTFTNTDVGQVIAGDFVVNGDTQVVTIYGWIPVQGIPLIYNP
jgi:hypothetical protein